MTRKAASSAHIRITEVCLIFYLLAVTGRKKSRIGEVGIYTQQRCTDMLNNEKIATTIAMMIFMHHMR